MALSSTKTERNVCISQRQKASGCCYISPRDDISHQALSRLPVSNHVSLGSCTVHIGQEGQSACSATSRRHTGLLQIALLTKPTMKESCMSQKTPFQVLPAILCKTKTVSPEKKKDIKADYAQLPAGPASGQFPKCLSPAICEIITPKNRPP